MESRKTLVPPPEARPRVAAAWRWLARHPVPGCWDRPLLTSIPPDPLAPDMASAAHFLSERWQRAWRPQKDEPYGVLRLRAPGRFTLRISLLEHGGAGGAGAGSSLWAHIKSETRGREEGTWLHPPADNKAGPAQSGQSRAGFPPAGGLLVAGTPSAAVSSSRAHVLPPPGTSPIPPSFDARQRGGNVSPFSGGKLTLRGEPRPGSPVPEVGGELDLEPRSLTVPP